MNSTAALEPSQKDIEQLAYKSYVDRGRQTGRDWEDWFEAKATLQLLEEYRQAAVTTLSPPRDDYIEKRYPAKSRSRYKVGIATVRPQSVQGLISVP